MANKLMLLDLYSVPSRLYLYFVTLDTDQSLSRIRNFKKGGPRLSHLRLWFRVELNQFHYLVA